MNRRLDKSATVLADSFVDFKRRASTALEMSGWLNVRVIKAKGFEDVTADMVDNNAGTVVTVQSFPYIDFSNSILIVNLTATMEEIFRWLIRVMTTTTLLTSMNHSGSIRIVNRLKFWSRRQ